MNTNNPKTQKIICLHIILQQTIDCGCECVCVSVDRGLLAGGKVTFFVYESTNTEEFQFDDSVVRFTDCTLSKLLMATMRLFLVEHEFLDTRK